MDIKKLGALVEVAMHNTRALQVRLTYEEAHQVIQKLLERRMNWTQLLWRCHHSSHCTRLVQALYLDCLHQRQLSQFVVALAELPIEWWEESDIEAGTVFGWWVPNGHEVLSALLVRHKDQLTDPEHPLCCRVPVGAGDNYWSVLVRASIRTGHFANAFDQVQSAQRGFRHNNLAPRSLQDPYRQQEYCWFASSECVGELVLEIYREMFKCRLVTQITTEDCVDISSGRVRRMVYETKIPAGHRQLPRAYETVVVRPGYEFALLFVDGSVRSNPVRFKESGAAILKIASHFTAQDDDKRRLAYEALLAKL